jgi:hypothetical protein
LAEPMLLPMSQALSPISTEGRHREYRAIA